MRTYMCDDNCRGRARYSRDSVMLGHPESMVAEAFSVTCEISGIAERFCRAAALYDRREVENRKWDGARNFVGRRFHPEE